MYIAINDFDMAGIHNTVTSIKQAGHVADFDVTQNKDGIVSIITDNWFLANDSTVRYEIHKIGKPRFLLSNRVTWIVQLYSKEPPATYFEKRGCIFERSLLRALATAEIDVKYNFMSVCSFEMALRAALD